MHFNTIITGMLTGGTAIIASLGLTAPAQAITSSGAAYIIEANGVYTLINNTALYVDSFVVSNPQAGLGTTSFTTQTGWASTVCTNNNCLGNISNGFYYYDSSSAADLGPGASSSNFFFNAQPASTFAIELRDHAGGDPVIQTGTAQPAVPTVPEPASWALLTIGFGAAGTALRRRRPVSSDALVA